MNFKQETIDKFNKAIPYYLECRSAMMVKRKYNIDNTKFAIYLKSIGIEVINYQNIQSIDDTIFSIIDSEEKAYWLGFICADGYISKKGNRVEITLKLSDVNHLNKFKTFIKYDKNIYLTNYSCRISFANKKIHDDLINLGCTSVKSLTLKFPSTKSVPKHLQKHFIRGYVDGDGCIRLLKRVHFYVGCLQIIGTSNFLYGIANSMNWNVTKLYKDKRHLHNTFFLNYGGAYVLNMLKDLYEDSTIYLDRKFIKYKEIEIKSNCRL
jgi:hypothetical protein